MMLLSKDHIHIKKEFGKYWLKIFYHNSTNGNWFRDEEINEIYTEEKFSIFGLVKDLKISDYYEFLLQYPSVEGYNNWKQKVFPLDASQSDNDDVHYYVDDTLHISWPNFNFSGLSRSSTRDSAILDGCNDGHWWFSIGAKKDYHTESVNTFPGPSTEEESYEVQEVYVWIRLPLQLIIPILRQSMQCTNTQSFVYMYYIAVLLC